MSIHLYLVSNSLVLAFLSRNKMVFTLHWLISSTSRINLPGSCLICGWLSYSNRTLQQHLPSDLTGENSDWVLCCTSFLVWDNSSCLWNLFASLAYMLCNQSSLSQSSPTVLAVSKDKLYLSLSPSASHPLLSKIVNSCLFKSICFEWTVSIFISTLYSWCIYPTIEDFIIKIFTFGLIICRCLSLHIINLVLKGKIERGLTSIN